MAFHCLLSWHLFLCELLCVELVCGPVQCFALLFDDSVLFLVTHVRLAT
jgi:hypothetical protein